MGIHSFFLSPWLSLSHSLSLYFSFSSQNPSSPSTTTQKHALILTPSCVKLSPANRSIALQPPQAPYVSFSMTAWLMAAMPRSSSPQTPSTKPSVTLISTSLSPVTPLIWLFVPRPPSSSLAPALFPALISWLRLRVLLSPWWVALSTKYVWDVKMALNQKLNLLTDKFRNQTCP